MKMTKRILSMIMAIVLLVSVVGVAAQAASVSLAKLNLGYMAPTNAKGTKTIETVKLYGNYDYINFYINSKKNNSYFFYEIYSDKDLTQGVESGYVECDKGTYAFSQRIKLKGTYKTKTYYMITYAAKIYSDGSAKIDKNSMYEFKVKVDRSADFDEKVVILKSVKNTYNGPKVSWSKFSGASKYYIYRRSITGTKWTKVGTVGSSKTSFTDTSVKNKNGNYIYTVKAINKKGTASRYLYSGLTCLFAKAPVISSISVVSNNTIQIKWDKTKSGAKYDIYRKEGDGGWKKIKSNYTGTTYKDTTAKNNKNYTYTVKAKISTSYGTATSAYYSNSDKTVTYLKAPTLKEAVAVENGINISWNSVSGTSTYKIYRKPLDKSEAWKRVGSVGSDILTFTDTTVGVDGAYIYTVRADAAKNKGSYYSNGIEYVKIGTPVANVIRNEENNQVTISWEKVSNATTYEVYGKVADGEWQLLKTTSDLKYSYYLNEFGDFEYKVRAVKDNEYYSEYSDILYYNQVPYITYSYMAYSDRIEMKWSNYGADAYNVYRKPTNSPDETYLLLATVNENQYTDTTIENDVSYTYQIKGVINGVEQTAYVKERIAGIFTEDALTEPPQLQVKNGVLYFNTDAVIYGYNFANECWEEIDYYDDESTQEFYQKYLNDGKYRFAFGYCVDDMKTPIDNSIIDYEWYDKTVDFDACVKNNELVVSFYSAGDEVEKYIVYADGYEKEVIADGSDEYEVVFDHRTKWPGDLYMEITICTKNGDITVTQGCPTLL